MNIVSFGCSLIAGTDLPDDGKHGPWATHSNLTWPALCAAKMGANYVCRAAGGSGNLCILNRVMDSICLWPDIFCVIGWTFIDRFDFSAINGRHYGGGGRDYDTLRPNETRELDQFYYRHLHSEHKDKFTNLVYIKTAIDCLKKANIPFLMTSIDDLLFGQRWHCSPAIIHLQEEIRPYIYNFEGRNFLDWSHHRGFEVSPTGHPLEHAHAVAADFMTPIIKGLLQDTASNESHRF